MEALVRAPTMSLGVRSVTCRKLKPGTEQLQDSCPQESKVQPQISGEITFYLMAQRSVTLGSQRKALGGEAQYMPSCPGTLLYLVTFGEFHQQWSSCRTEPDPVRSSTQYPSGHFSHVAKSTSPAHTHTVT